MVGMADLRDQCNRARSRKIVDIEYTTDALEAAHSALEDIDAMVEAGADLGAIRDRIVSARSEIEWLLVGVSV